jgi:hypothetical protein
MKIKLGNGLSFADSDIVNLDDFIPAKEYNPYNVHPFLIHDHGFTVGIAFASNLQEALDELADHGKLDHFKVTEKELESDYEYDESSGEHQGISWLGNNGLPYDIETIGCIELKNPPLSFCALYAAMERS